jgi:hypothetical protein
MKVGFIKFGYVATRNIKDRQKNPEIVQNKGREQII